MKQKSKRPPTMTELRRVKTVSKYSSDPALRKLKVIIYQDPRDSQFYAVVQKGLSTIGSSPMALSATNLDDAKAHGEVILNTTRAAAEKTDSPSSPAPPPLPAWVRIWREQS